ncbi:unnamed protein product [Malus baccata var. baccata]
MKKITLAFIVVAVLTSVVLAAKDSPKASAAPAPSKQKDSASAPKPSSADSITLSVVGSFAGVFLSSFVGYYLQDNGLSKGDDH